MTETRRSINEWTPEDFQANIRKASGIVSCAFGVGTFRSKKTGRWTTLLVFHDDDRDTFSHVFEFSSDTEVFHLAKLLIDSRDLVKKLAKDGP